MPRLTAARRDWKRRVLWLDGLVIGGLAALAVVLAAINGALGNLGTLDDWFRANPIAGSLTVAAVLVAVWLLHRFLRNIAARGVQRRLERDAALGTHAPRVARAFRRNARSWWPFLAKQPVGWTRGARKRLDRVLSSAHATIQELNDRYADPSGRSRPSDANAATAAAAPAPVPAFADADARYVPPAVAAEAIDTGPAEDTDRDIDANGAGPEGPVPPPRDDRRFTVSHGTRH